MGFGARMRLMRAYRKVSQEELGQRTDIIQPVLSRLESGQVLPSDTTRKQIRAVLQWGEAADRALDMLELAATPPTPTGSLP